MSEEEKKDVTSESSTDSESDPESKKGEEEGDNKNKNFAELRKKVKELENENVALKKTQEGEVDKRSLSLKEEEKDEEEDNKGKTKKPELNTSEYQKLLFDRDMKRAVKSWSTKNKVSADEWTEVKKLVSLKGDETDLEIEEKIESAYHSLPSVRKKREADIIVKARKEAMKQFKDDELDLGGGGDVDFNSDTEPRFNSKEKKWLDNFGVKPEDRKKIDKSSVSHKDWTILDPVRR